MTSPPFTLDDLIYHGSDPVLIVPDVHADTDFLLRILAEAPAEQFGKIIFLGDYLDGRDTTTRGPQSVTRITALLKSLTRTLGDKLVMLWGNHDLCSYSLRGAAKTENGGRVDASAPTIITGILPETRSCHDVIHRAWDREFWEGLRPFYQAHGTLLSHAGLHARFFPHGYHECFVSILDEWEVGMAQWADGKGLHPLLSMGEARGGPAGTVGGLLWQDWDLEFEDSISLPQIVGHTAGAAPRRKGRSWCIDAKQRGYAVLDSKLEFFRV